MRTEVANRLTMTKSLVSARREPESQDRYAWVWVFPLQDGTFRVSTVEIPKNLVDEDICFAEEDIERVQVAVVATLEAVDSAVSDLGVDPNSLDAPWKNDFPL
ncbi:hypothetical protein RM704_27030 [Streptomyces sp. DSM 3412]|uniref:HicB-like antitoxin of toxin-antitoxin system domain-containing protein n=1 Tax=Streptomyces gottesmaniae TaxID=3075518 RepID=A0ABU2Z3B4_9ACTN|nr:hypothetical protein [Streptomyces sp. DSM 3412]MDT0571073.1 hypothetical protein [Streptomyces sp. DSM 3412]